MAGAYQSFAEGPYRDAVAFLVSACVAQGIVLGVNMARDFQYISSHVARKLTHTGIVGSAGNDTHKLASNPRAGLQVQYACSSILPGAFITWGFPVQLVGSCI
jgi:azurin